MNETSGRIREWEDIKITHHLMEIVERDKKL